MNSQTTMKSRLFYYIFLFVYQAALWPTATAAASSASYMTRRRLASRSESRLTSSTTATVMGGASTRPRTACKFYIWNAPSAMLYKWCQHLMKDHIYEGRGGVKVRSVGPFVRSGRDEEVKHNQTDKVHTHSHLCFTQFVRIEPGSVLQLLYPCSRYSPDSCIFCGGTFPDHMTLTWAKHLYTPFDRYLDWVRDKGVVVPLPEPSPKRGRTRSTTASSSDNANEPTAPRHVFHRRYVQDKDQEGEEDGRNKSRRTNNNKRTEKGVFYRRCEHVTYQIPFQEVTLLRAVVLAAVESLIRWETHDDQLARRRVMKDHACC